MAWAYRQFEPPSGIMFCYRFEADTDKAYWDGAEWCVEQFGPLKPGNRGVWTVNAPRIIWLLRPNDAFAFRMRWC